MSILEQVIGFILIVATLFLISWGFASLIMIFCLALSGKGFKKEWEDVGYVNLFKVIYDIIVFLLSPIRFLYRAIKLNFMDGIDREIHERKQRIKYLEKARKKIEVLNDVKRKEETITKKFLEETDELDIEAHKLGLEVPHEREYE